MLGALVVGLPISLLPATAGAQPTAAPTAPSAGSGDQGSHGWHGKPTDLPKVPLMVGGQLDAAAHRPA